VKSKNDVEKCLSSKTMITAAPRIGVTIASIRRVRSREMVTNGSNIRLLRSPGDIRVLRVINKFVNEIVVLTPAKTTLKSNTSCAPRPVNLN